MIRRRLGEITKDEKDRMRDLYDRKCALEETALTLDSEFTTEEQRQMLKKKIDEKMELTKLEYSGMWENLSKQYGWIKEESENWMIDFQSNEIFAAKLNH